jgi:hypothetical protein
VSAGAPEARREAVAADGSAAVRAGPSRLDRAGLAWLLVVAAVYIATTLAVGLSHSGHGVDRAMTIATNIANGSLSSGLPPGSLDTVTVGGMTYQVISPLPLVPYLAFVPVPALWEASRWIIATGLGILAAWLTLPLARRYGPGGSATWWIASLGAFGTLLWTQSIAGNFYYLAHVEAILFTFVALVEWRGRRRPWVIGLALGLASLARPTVLLAAIPFGVAFLRDGRDRWRHVAGFAAPLALAVGVTALYDAVRFGSPFETGYGISVLARAALIRQRARGVFSVRHVPDNIFLLVFRGFDLQTHFPYLVPDPNGHSLLLTSPGLLAAVSSGVRTRTTRILWAAAFLVAVPLLLYYGGGGFRTYGYRYALDFMPFLLALVAIGARGRFGALEKLLIIASIGFVAYGVVWAVAG